MIPLINEAGDCNEKELRNNVADILKPKYPILYQDSSKNQLEKKNESCGLILAKLENQGYIFANRKQIYKIFESKSVLEIIEKLRNGSISPIEAYAYYFFMTVEIDSQTNAVFDYIVESFDQMMVYQKIVDGKEKLERDLFALPISIKDTFDIAGYSTTYGLQKFLNNIPEKDCFVVETLKSLGAVPFCKTSIPETCASYKAENKITGRTQHSRAFNDSLNLAQRTPGGSSSGEAVLVALGGSPIGFGSDGVGSIRIPAGFNGLFGMRITTERISSRSYQSKPAIGSFFAPNSYVVGPITKDPETLSFVMKILFANPITLKMDPFSPPVPFQSSLYHSESQLRFGYFSDYGTFPCPDYLKRSINETKEKLESQGHQCIDISSQIPDFIDLYYTLTFKLICADGGEIFLNNLKGFEPCEINKELIKFMKMPALARKLIKTYYNYKDVMKKKKLENLDCSLSLTEYLKLVNGNLDKLKRDIYHLFTENSLDLILCPLWETPAERYDSPLDTVGILVTTLSLTNFPVGVVPVAKISQTDIDQVQKDFRTVDSKDDNESLAAVVRMKKDILANVDQDALGLPLALQVMAPPFKDELILRALEIIGSDWDK